MKNLFCTLLLIATLIFTVNIKAQQKQSAKSLLWEVSGNGLTKPSYIYGTIHMICEPDFLISDKTKSAMTSADNLVLELNFTDPSEITELQKSIMSAIPLSKKLSPSQFNRLDSVLTLKTGTSLKKLDQLTLAAITSFAIAKTLPCSEIKSYEVEFINFAKAQNKTIGALETVKQQTEFFAKAFSDDELVRQITSFDDYKTVFSEMISTYKMEDLDKVSEMLKDKRWGNTEESNKWMLQVRNANWANHMPAMMKNQSCFFAVGCGHLPGKDGILQLLKNQGYKVKPILK
ncbi:TraB/GumN family protein [Pedobacter hiemivivus]|uniref:TraB/GumN family protein n=1 Tax=Pedobacter hiemivivus TaxID=2530454 RepID=A0A4V2MJP2_9SPHI|nr:TraB/GumN family protein [Pedobacter hiemivivus]TCC95046.1 TraB/GumN family protein [Pedobacter hiemivivus]